MRIPLLSLKNSSLIADAVFLAMVTIGAVLLVGGLSITIIAASLPAKISGVASIEQSILGVLGLIPGIPLSINDIANCGLTATGIVAWIIGLDILVVGLGLWAQNKLAKWMAFGIFGLAAYFSFQQLLLLGVLGATNATVSLSVNALIIYLLWKVDFVHVDKTLFVGQKRSEVLGSVAEESKISANQMKDAPPIEEAEALENFAANNGDISEQNVEVTTLEAETTVQKETETNELLVVPKKEVYAANQNETVAAAVSVEKVPMAPAKQVPGEEIPEASEIRLIIREIPLIVYEESGNSERTLGKQKTRVTVQKSHDGVPVVVVETDVKVVRKKSSDTKTRIPEIKHYVKER